MSSRLFRDDVVFLQRLLCSAGCYSGPRDGVWRGAVDEGEQQLERIAASLAAQHGAFDDRSERHIRSLHPRAQLAARGFLTAARAAGIDARIISGTRTYAEQDALYRIGRFGDTRKRVTNAKAGASNHNFGFAWDIGLFENGKLPHDGGALQAGGGALPGRCRVGWQLAHVSRSTALSVGGRQVAGRSSHTLRNWPAFRERLRPMRALSLLVLPILVWTGSAVSRQSATWPGRQWPTATPESLGLKAEPLAAIDRDIKAGVFGNIDHLFVAINGTAIVDQRYPRDYREISRGRTSPIGCGEGCTDPSWMHEFNYFHPNWHPYYQGRDVHTLQSVTKSIAATVVGIALGRGEITGLDRPFLSFFKDRDLSRVDPRLHRATLDDLLTMRSGIEWHEQDRPLDETNTTIQLERSKDWIAFTLSQPMDADPGTKWAYNSGGSQLMSGIIRDRDRPVHRRVRG